MFDTKVGDSVETLEESENGTLNIAQTLKAAAVTHPGLKRLRTKLVSKGETEIAITSYDRMHHRHNRS